MKIRSSKSGVGGFSLIELMVVIGIIVVLAGMLIASLPGITNRINRSKVTQFMAELEGGLSGYKIDNGIYPPNSVSGGDLDKAGLEGSEVLYKYLSGDWNEDGALDDDEEIYVPKLYFDVNQESKTPRSISFGSDYVVVDAYNSPIRYIAMPPNTPDSDRRKAGVRNPTYDLWSIVDTDPAAASDFSTQAKYITNWQSN